MHEPAPRLPSLTALRAFEAAARHLSFKQAADALALTPTAISHQIRQLEQHLGVRLFVRQPRRIQLTEAGMRLYHAVHQAFGGIVEAVRSIQRADTQPSVTVTTTRGFAARWLLPRLPALHAATAVDLHLHASDAPVESRTGGTALAIRYGHGPFPGWRSVPLLPCSFVAVASPELARRMQQVSPIHWPRLQFQWARRDTSTPDWTAWFALQAATPQTRPVASFSDEAHAIQAAIAGQGVLLANLVLVADAMAEGALMAITGPGMAGHPFHLLHTNPADPAVHSVMRWLRHEADAWQQRHAAVLHHLR